MAYFKDFTPCTYFATDEWQCRLMAIGWIEQGKPFPRGTVGDGVIERIATLREEFGRAFPAVAFRGLHECSLCDAGGNGASPLKHSHINLFLPHRGFVFVAPGRVDHAIQAHGYQPPESFLQALMHCPSPLSESFQQTIRASNRGVDAPLYR